MKKPLVMMTLAGVGSAHALVLDDFTTGPTNMLLSGPSMTQSATYQTGSMVGGARYSELTLIDNPDDNAARLRINTTTGVLSLSNQDLVQSTGAILYGVDASLSQVDLNLDLSAFDRFRFTVRSVDLPTTLRMFVVDAENGNAAFNTSVNISAGFTGNVDVLFSDWGTFDFSDVDGIAFHLETPASGDISITRFEAVPEPATLAVLGLGAAAMLRRRRK